MTIFAIMKRAVLLTICSVSALLVGSLTAPAQVPAELEAFQAAAGARSSVFRGKQAARYTFPANGHPYWAQPAFETGDMIFEGNLYQHVVANIDAAEQRLLVRMTGSPVAIALAPAQVSSFTLGERRFVGIGPGESLPEGFYEVFGQGPEQVYKHVQKRLESSVNDVNGSTIGYYDEDYRPDVTRYFYYIATYYFRDAAGQFTPFKGRGALIRRFPDRKRQIRQGLRAAFAGRPDFDTYCKMVLQIAAQ